MGKQTAVEWLIVQIINDHNNNALTGVEWKKVFNQAKAMEKQQSIYDYCEGFKASGEGWNGEYGLDNILDVAGEIDAEQYYNETYVNKEIEEIKSEFVCQMEDCPHCAYEEQERYEAALEKDAAVEFAKWLAQDWMAIWVVDKWMWENVDGLASKNYKHNGMYYTEEELYELYLKSE